MMDGETPAIVVEAVTTEADVAQAEAGAEAVETATEAAVEIAQIEAERDITIEAIRADAHAAEAEALVEVAAISEDESQWRQNIEAQLMTTQDQLSQVQETLSILAQSMQPEPSPPTNSPESEEGAPLVEVEVEAAQPAPEPPKRAKKSRWI